MRYTLQMLASCRHLGVRPFSVQWLGRATHIDMHLTRLQHEELAWGAVVETCPTVDGALVDAAVK